MRVAAPPEGGRANRAVCAVIAAALGVRPGQVSIESGRTSPEKVVRVSEMTAPEAQARLARKTTQG